MNDKHTFKLWEPREKMVVLGIFSLILIAFGLIYALGTGSFLQLLYGLWEIIIHPDVLIIDYIAIGGLGAAFLNAGLLTAACTYILAKSKQPFNGIAFAAVFTIAGFSFLGKNLLNVWPILIGSALYAKTKKEPLSTYIYISLFGTAMSPVITEVIFHLDLPLAFSLLGGMLLGVGIGFVLPPLAAHFAKAHQGFNLYNVGFVAGLLLTAVAAIFKSFGYEAAPNFIFAEDYHWKLIAFSYSLNALFVVAGFATDSKTFLFLKRSSRRSGQAPTDFIALDGFSSTLANIGLNGAIATTYILAVGGHMNGVLLGAIFTVMGFSAFGKTPRTILPIMIGIFCGGLLGVWDVSAPGMIMAALFGTALSPIPGKYGIFWGIVAGFFHGALVRQTGSFHAGLNLYNNGFAAGIVAMIMIPILQVIAKPLKIKE